MYSKLLFISMFIGALNTASAAGWYRDFTIEQVLYSAGADGLHFEPSTSGTGDPNPDGCTRSDLFYIPYSSSTPERNKAMLVGANMAFALQKNVRAYVSGCVAGIGGSTYPKVHYFYVNN